MLDVRAFKAMRIKALLHGIEIPFLMNGLIKFHFHIRRILLETFL